MDISKDIKHDFPIFKEWDIAYLDNAATSQKPYSVIEAESKFYALNNANVHRASYSLGLKASQAFEDARAKIGKFVGVHDPDAVIFTKNATEAINIVARGLIPTRLKQGSTVLVSRMEHHANFVPWQQLSKTHKLNFQTIPVTDEGQICLDSYKKLLADNPAVVCLSHCSNVLGNITLIKEFVQLAKKVGALTVVDGTQAVPHLTVDVPDIGADFYTFTGHKMLGPTGIGVLTGEKASLELLSPSTFGGDMIDRVTLSDSSFAQLPSRLEAGTPPVAQAIGLAAACDYLTNIGLHNVRSHEQKLLSILHEGLDSIKEVQTYGAKQINSRSGICAFNVTNAHAHDISMVLDQMKVCVRSGDHCAQPLMTELGMQGSLRASIYIYNSENDIERMIKAVQKAVKLFVK